SSGIGKSIVETLLREGVTVCVFDMREPNIDPSGGDAAGGTLLYQQVDVSDGDAVDAAVEAAAASMGGLDVVVNNAGITRKGRVEEIANTDWRSTFAVNLDGVMHVSRAAIPHLKQSGRGRII